MSQNATSNPSSDTQLRAAIDRSLRHPVMFFFTSGAAWLAVSVLLGIIASIKTLSPGFLDGCAWSTYGRVFAAHTNTLVYGWGCQAAFGAMIWLMSRLSRQPSRAAGVILTAGHVWNFGLTLGILSIFAGFGTGKTWMEFPSFVWPVLLLSYALIGVWSVVQFRCRPEGHTFISQWYCLAALVWFPWFYIAANLLINTWPGHPLMGAAINSWFKSAMIFLFFVPAALGMAYYLVPKVSGRPVASYSLSMLGFWSLAVVAPWAGMQKLTGAPIPYFLPYVGAAATILLAVPAIVSGTNLIRTVAGTHGLVGNSPTLRFTLAGVIGLIILGGACLVLNMNQKISQFSMSGYGFDLLAVYGFFSLVMFGAIYFIVPRITRREWLSSTMIKMHFFTTIYGLAVIVVGTLLGGLEQGIGQEMFRLPWHSAALRTLPYEIFTLLAWICLLVSNIFFCLHLLLMWLRLGRRSSHPTLLGGEHGEESPHGAEGDIDNCGPAFPTAH